MNPEITLLEKQQLFVQMVAMLIEFAYKCNYSLSFGDAYRDPRVSFPYSHKKSLHKIRLAIDFNVFKEGKILLHGAEFKELGEYWESIGGAWGNSFGDGSHFSIEHEGMK